MRFEITGIDPSTRQPIRVAIDAPYEAQAIEAAVAHGLIVQHIHSVVDPPFDLPHASTQTLYLLDSQGNVLTRWPASPAPPTPQEGRIDPAASGPLVVLTSLVVIVGVLVVPILVIGGVHATSRPTSGVFAKAMFWTSTLLLLTSILPCGLFPDVPITRQLRLIKPRGHPLAWIISLVGAVVLAIAVSQMVAVDPRDRPFNQTVAGETGGRLAILVVLAALVAPTAEELFFRGLLMTHFRVLADGTVVGVVVTAVLFGLVHFDLTQGGFALVMGLWLGAMSASFGSVIPSMIAHVVINSLALLSVGDDRLPGFKPGLVGGMLTFAGCCAVWWMLLEPKQPEGDEHG